MDVLKTPKQGSRVLKKAAGLAVVAALIVAIVGFLVRPSSAAAPAVDKTAMWTEKVKRGDLLRQVPVQGALVPEKVQWLSAQTAARVARIAVKRGAEVEPETVVVVLENTELELAALEAERQAATAEARLIELDVKSTSDAKLHASAVAGLRVDLRDADRIADRANRLAPEGLLSENERRDAIERVSGLAHRMGTEEERGNAIANGRVRQLGAARSEIERIKEIAAFRRRQLAALEVKAGVKGVVQDIPLENGQWVAIGTVLAKVAEPGHLKAEVKVAESYARDLSKGMAVRFEGAGPNGRGKIDRIDPAVVAGSVRLEVQLDAIPPGARVDQRVTGYVEIERLENVLSVARPAGVLDGATAQIFRLDHDRASASRVTVTLGRGSAREVEVVSGLEAGDEIVVSDVSGWDGASRVRLK